MNILAKTVFGSRLYGTHTDTSDYDYRGCYLPDVSTCYLGKIKDTIDAPEEDDTQFFSLQRFIRLAAEGQSVAIEMLWTPGDKHVLTSSAWELLRENRKLFLTKKMKSFMGYAKTMSGKYSVRAERLIEVEMLIAFLNDYMVWEDAKLSTIYDALPVSTNLTKGVNTFNRGADNRVYIMCGREYQATVTIGHLRQAAVTLRDNYGSRVKKAALDEADYKALMHAYRVCYQCQQAAKEGVIHFPCKEVTFLRQIRNGELDLKNDGLDKRLDDLINETEELVKNSTLAEDVDWNWCEGFILEVYEQYNRHAK